MIDLMFLAPGIYDMFNSNPQKNYIAVNECQRLDIRVVI